MPIRTSFALALVLFGVAVAVGDDGWTLVQPSVQASPSRQFELSIDPSDRYGQGAAAYRMSRGDAKVWSSTLPFTLVDVSVTNAGEVIGYAYSDGYRGFAKGDGYGDFRVVILAPDGSPRLNEATERTGSRYLHEAPDPKCIGVIVNAAKDLVTFRISNPDVNQRDESRWQYRVSTGALVSKRDGQARVADAPSKKKSRPKLNPPVAKPLERITQFKLRGHAKPVASPIHNVYQFTVDDQRRIAFVRTEADEDRTDMFVAIDRHGKSVFETPLPIVSGAHDTSCTWITGDRFLVTRSRVGIQTKSKAWWVNVAAKTITAIDGFDCAPVTRICRFSDGGFVALATERFEYTMSESLIGFDQSGKRIWARGNEMSRDQSVLFSPDDIAVTGNDQVAVIDNIRKSIQWFDRHGTYLRSVDLETAWGREPNYPTDLMSLDVGSQIKGLLVHDFNGIKPYVAVDQTGKIQFEFVPHFDNGRRLDETSRCVAPDGSIWLSDREAIYRLDQDGKVAETLGSNATAHQLTRIAAVAIGRDGRVCVVDGRTATAHVFDSSGQFMHQSVLGPDQFRGEMYSPAPSISDQGTVSISVSGPQDTARVFRFDADGKPIRQLSFDVDSDEVLAQPGTDRFVALTYEEVHLFDRQGKLIRKIDHRPDGQWMVYPQILTFANDGSFAVVSDRMVCIFSNDATPIIQFDLPSPVTRYAAIAINKDRVVAVSDRDLTIQDRNGKLIQYSRLDVDRKDSHPCFTADESELMLVPREASQVNRYAVP
ncbi:MAG: hypothetical protein WBD31_11310 [Rubripirellula sp.]